MRVPVGIFLMCAGLMVSCMNWQLGLFLAVFGAVMVYVPPALDWLFGDLKDLGSFGTSYQWGGGWNPEPKSSWWGGEPKRFVPKTPLEFTDESATAAPVRRIETKGAQ